MGAPPARGHDADARRSCPRSSRSITPATTSQRSMCRASFASVWATRRRPASSRGPTCSMPAGAATPACSWARPQAPGPKERAGGLGLPAAYDVRKLDEDERLLRKHSAGFRFFISRTVSRRERHEVAALRLRAREPRAGAVHPELPSVRLAQDGGIHEAARHLVPALARTFAPSRRTRASRSGSTVPKTGAADLLMLGSPAVPPAVSPTAVIDGRPLESPVVVGERRASWT